MMYLGITVLLSHERARLPVHGDARHVVQLLLDLERSQHLGGFVGISQGDCAIVAARHQHALAALQLAPAQGRHASAMLYRFHAAGTQLYELRWPN